MKQSFQIITHIKNQPKYSKLKIVKCYETIKGLLPPRFRNGILFIYTKNDTLFFVLSHPAFKMEFNYNLNLIKSVLKKIKNFTNDCDDIAFNDIKVFVSNKIKAEEEIDNKEDSKIIYSEKSSGDFDIKTNNKNLKKRFENIKKIIRSQDETNHNENNSSRTFE